MKLPISWLKDYVEIKITPEELADRLTMTGLEVEEVLSAVTFEKVVVGEVLEREKHPNADKLNVAKVNVGTEILQIVCGAPNLNVGQKVPVAVPGAKLGDFEITKRELRGVASSGMICSEKELGIGEDREGIMVLDKKATAGTDFAQYLKADKLLDIKIFANRPDLMGILGLAREVAAALNKKFVPKEIKLSENSKEKTSDLVSLEIKDAKLCPRYVARIVKDVKIAESQKWLKDRLVACGVRPINNIVDISNYVMLEYGQPLHFFDLDKLGKNPKIVVRKAKANEEIVTLDGIKRKLTADNLVIADSSKAIALAGVMGGENTEVDDKTKNILIEAAVFEKANIRKTSRSLGLRSEAVARFEKGIPFELPAVAIERAAELLQELASGQITKGVVEEVVTQEKKGTIRLDFERINKFLGADISEKETLHILDILGFEVHDGEVAVPWWRPDVENLTDLTEEIVRIWGYEKLPSTLPLSGSSAATENSFSKVEKLRKLLAALGYTEILTYSFISKKDLEAVGEDTSKALKLANPLVAEQEYLRTSLLPHMLTALKDNQFNKEEIRFFEIGKAFIGQNKGILPLEKRYLQIGVVGGKTWPFSYEEGREYFELRGLIDRILPEFGVAKFEITKHKAPGLNPQTAAAVKVGKEIIGAVGEVDAKVMSRFGLKKACGVLTLDLELLFALSNETKAYQDFSKYQYSLRDISVLLGQNDQIQTYVEAISAVNKLVKNVEVVDIYTGKPLEKGQRSVTFRITIQSDEKTLVEAEIDKVYIECQNKIKKLGGVIRGAKES